MAGFLILTMWVLVFAALFYFEPPNRAACLFKDSSGALQMECRP